jgi:hypothetical protein
MGGLRSLPANDQQRRLVPTFHLKGFWPSRALPQLSLGPIDLPAEPNGIKPTEMGSSASLRNGEPYKADSSADKPKPAAATGPKLPFALAEPMELYRLLLWSPFRILLWQQAVISETTLKFLRH